MTRPRAVSSPSVPGPLLRLLRDRVRTAGVALLAVALLTASGVRTGGAADLQSTLDENWRGLYDLLVTAPGSATELEGLLSPSTITSLSRRMSLDDVAEVGAVEGVEVAAPIGEAVISASFPSRLRFAVPIAQGVTTSQPIAYRATLTWMSHDGLAERVVAHDTVVLAVDDADLPTTTVLPPSEFHPNDLCVVGGEEVPIVESEICRTVNRHAVQVQTADGWYGSFDVVDGYLTFGFDGEPVVNPYVALVDPEAEQALLGEEAQFLAPLVDADRSVTLESLGFEGDGDVPVVPFVVADDVDLPLRVEVVVESGFGPVEQGGMWGSWVLPEEVATAPGTHVGAATHDVSALLRPFSADPVYLTWPGAPELTAAPTPPAWLAQIGGSVTTGELPAEPVGAPDASLQTLRLTADRFLDTVRRTDRSIAELVIPERDGSVPGRESMYRREGLTSVPPATGSSGGLPPSAVVVGEYDPAAVAPADDGLGYVPVGGVDPGSSALVAGPDGTSVDEVELAPSLSGFGVANATPAAFGDIARAPEWGLTRPVSAIRVRVAGVGDYTPESRATVLSVAERIADLGYTVTLAAGSSREDVRLLVDGYAFGTADPTVPQSVGTLGVVEQRWPRLGAAVTVEDAVTGAANAALWLAVGGAALLLGAAQAVAVPGRRRDAVTLRTLGWRRRDILRWFAAEEAAAVLIVLVAAGLAVALTMVGPGDASGGSERAALGAGVLAVMLISVAGLVASARTPRPRRFRPVRRRVLRLRGARLRSVRMFGLVQVRQHPVHAATMAVATVLVGAAGAATVAVVRAGVEAAGRTDLGVFAAARGAGFQVATGLVGLVGGVLLLRLAQRTDRHVRAGQWRTLRALGWTAREIGRARRAELLTVLLPALAVVGLAVGLSAVRLEVADPVLVTATALAGSGLAVAALLMGARRRTETL